MRISPREKELLGHLVSGEPNKTIAHGMGITEATVKIMLCRLFLKVRVDNRTKLALYAQREGYGSK